MSIPARYENGVFRPLEGKTVSIDATTLEANAALRSLVRRDNGQKCDEYLKGLGPGGGDREPHARATGTVRPQAEEEGFQ
jgi:predicted DNA-binding antitoxin AbrB/MazE fold protein